MKSFFTRGPARRVRELARRRAIAFAPQLSENLEARRLLAAGSLGINVEIGTYQSFVNWFQTAQNWGPNPGQSNTIIDNASGDPTSDATVVFDLRVNQPWNGPDPNAVGPNLSGTYNLTFNGQATVSPEYPGFSTPFTVQNQTYNVSTNTTTAQLVVPANTTAEFFGITFSNTLATSTSVTNTGFSNARLIRPGYSANSTQLYTNEFIAALAPYGTLRYLDPENTNGQPFYNGNTLVTFNASAVDQTGMPWEYLVALANATNTDMWINIPQGATDDYVTALAGIIKNGGTVNGVAYAGLKSNLKVYVEYSNEVWGGIPYNEYYQEAAVQNTATNQPLSTFPGNQYVYQNPDGSTSTDIYQAASRRYLERTAEIGQIFQNVIGADPTHQRIRPVLGWQENNTSFYPPAFAWFEKYFGTASASFYGMGNANYWNATDLSSVDAAIASLQAQETSYAIPNNIDFTALATFYGLKNVSYEGGPSISGDPSTAAGQVALAASRDPRMEQLVYQHYINYFADGGTLGNYYDGPFGTLAPGNEWPIAELSQYGNPSASSRYRGTVDVANASPVAVTAGIQVSGSSPTSFSALTDTLGTSFSRPSTGEQGFWLLNVGSTATADLSLSMNSGTGSTPAQFEILLNDKPVGNVFTQGITSSLDLGNFSLSAGLNTLSIVILNPGSQFQPMSFSVTPASSAPSVPSIGDPNFTQLNEGTGFWAFTYAPTGSPWTFSNNSYGNGSGLAGNGSAFTSGNPNSPVSTQVSFLQGTGTITQTVSNWAAGNYTLSFNAADRANYGVSLEDFEVLIDGVVVGSFLPTNTSYQQYTTSSFTVTAGAHTIQFLGIDTAGKYDSVFLDQISVAVAKPPSVPSVPSIGDPNFTQLNEGTGFWAFTYAPTGSPWTFSNNSYGNGSGLAGNGSAFTSGNPNSPVGTQVAFLQGTGTITQTVSNWTAGTYTLSFNAADRANYGVSLEDFEVLIDGVVVGSFLPTNTSYQQYTTSSFTVTAGAHTIQFLGIDTAGKYDSVFLDNVTIA